MRRRYGPQGGRDDLRHSAIDTAFPEMFPVFLRPMKKNSGNPAFFCGERGFSACLFLHEAGRDLAPAFAVFQDFRVVGGTAHDEHAQSGELFHPPRHSVRPCDED